MQPALNADLARVALFRAAGARTEIRQGTSGRAYDASTSTDMTLYADGSFEWNGDFDESTHGGCDQKFTCSGR